MTLPLICRLGRLASVLLLPLSLGAQAAGEETVSQAKMREALEKNSETFRFGLSLGWRHNMAKKESLNSDLGVDPMTGRVSIERIDRGAFVLSGVVAAYPWRRSDLQRNKGAIDECPTPGSDRAITCRIGRTFSAWHWGTIANLNLASFNADAISTFNKSIEGGLGVAYKLNEEFSLAVTLERIFGRKPREFVKPGAQLKDKEDNILYAIDASDNTWFRDDNMSAWSVKFVYFLK